MKLNDYAALHGMLAPGEANQQQQMQSQPHLATPIQSEQSTYLLGVHGMRDMKGFSSTAYIVK